ncbi:MAG: acyl carrier protein [Clostridia bacterium]|nr:acyl carrier protein [Oscillospiraceae bacterium]MCI6973645.1 acyl carrier protein [Clostridiales bacterium]MDO4354592.1 acyl carrier protein [Clostridia bacterium]MDY2909530.1 acyl carrier protein [Oscillospiraceae bacterium]
MTFDKIRELLAQQFEVSADSISMETNIVDDLGGDSLDVVDLIMSVEEEFGISIPDEDAVELSTVGKIVEYIEKQQ